MRLENEKIDIAKRHERLKFSQLEDSIQSFQQIYAAANKEGPNVEKSKAELSKADSEDSVEKELESQQSNMEQCKEQVESTHPVQKLYSDENLLSEQ